MTKNPVRVTDNWLTGNLENKIISGNKLLVENKNRFTVTVQKNYS